MANASVVLFAVGLSEWIGGGELWKLSAVTTKFGDGEHGDREGLWQIQRQSIDSNLKLLRLGPSRHKKR